MYDNGGWLEPGESAVANASDCPEPVFTSEQWKLLAERGRGE